MQVNPTVSRAHRLCCEENLGLLFMLQKDTGTTTGGRLSDLIFFNIISLLSEDNIDTCLYLHELELETFLGQRH